MCEIGIVFPCCNTAKQLSPQTFAQNKQQSEGTNYRGQRKGAGTNCRTCSWFAQHMYGEVLPWWQVLLAGLKMSLKFDAEPH